MMLETKQKCSCPWQVLLLVSNRLDPKNVARASCVCKSWYVSMSSDHIWQPICSSHYPSLANLRLSHYSNNPMMMVVPYRQLYAMGFASSRRRLEKPLNPKICLDDLIFSIDIILDNKKTKSNRIASVVRPGGSLVADENAIFRFDIDVHADGLVAVGALDNLRIMWNIVLLKELNKGAFTMMECKGKGSFVLGLEGWFSEELPCPGCCSTVSPSGLVADLRLGLRERCGKVLIDKVSVGVLSIVSWRYVGVDDTLRYLQHFLLPPQQI